MKKIHYSWFICFGCTLVFFCTVGLGSTGFSAYLPYLVTLKGFSNSQISMLIFLRSLFSVLGMMAVNPFVKRFEVRRAAFLAMMICVVSFVLFGLSDSFYSCGVASALAGLAYGVGGMVPVSLLISRWFIEHRGLAVGICMSASGVSAFIASPLITFGVEQFSLRSSFLAEAMFVFASGILVWFVLRSEPACLEMKPLGTQSIDHVETNHVYAEKTAPAGLYMMMAFGFLILGAAANNISGNLSVLYQSVGIGSRQISLLISLFGISLAAGKCIYGVLADKIGVSKACIMLYVFSIAGSGLCCLAGAGGFLMACVAVVLVGFGLAVASVATATYATEIAQEKDYSGIVSKFQTMQTLGGLIFANVPGILADRTGDYILPYVLMFAFIVAASVIIQVFYIIIKRWAVSERKVNEILVNSKQY